MKPTGELSRVNTAEILKGVSEGSRNTSLFQLASKFRGADVPYDHAVTMLMDTASKCHPPYPANEAQRIIDRVYTQYQPNEKPVKAEVVEKKETALDRWVSVIRQASRFFHAPGGNPYALLSTNGHLDVYPIGDAIFSEWVRHVIYATCGDIITDEQLRRLVAQFSAEAKYSDTVTEVFYRVGGDKHTVYIDLGDANRNVVKITADGWEVVQNLPVPFQRRSTMLPLPIPQHGGKLSQLQRYLNISKDQYPLVVGWLVAALQPSGSYPLLNLTGSAGSGKSTAAKTLRNLIDPVSDPTRSIPKSTDELRSFAANNYVIILDNLSKCPDWLSDELCRLSTEGGMVSRKLYLDNEENVVSGKRPMILTGLNSVVSRGDLGDRTFSVDLRSLGGSYGSEEEYAASFAKDAPYIFGALCDAVSTALRRLPEVPKKMPIRLADVGRWIVAAEPALGIDFLAAYQQNRQEAAAERLDTHPVAVGILELMEYRSRWEGTASDLFEALKIHTSYSQLSDIPSWAKGPNGLGRALVSLEPDLDKAGISVSRGRSSSAKVITLTRK